MDPRRCNYCKDVLKYDYDDELEALVVVVQLLVAGATSVVGGQLAAVATVAVGMSSSTNTSTSISIGVDDVRWTYTVRLFVLVVIDVVVGPSVAAATA